MTTNEGLEIIQVSQPEQFTDTPQKVKPAQRFIKVNVPRESYFGESTTEYVPGWRELAE